MGAGLADGRRYAHPSRSRSRILDSRDPENLRFSDDTAVRASGQEA